MQMHRRTPALPITIHHALTGDSIYFWCDTADRGQSLAVETVCRPLMTARGPSWPSWRLYGKQGSPYTMRAHGVLARIFHEGAPLSSIWRRVLGVTLEPERSAGVLCYRPDGQRSHPKRPLGLGVRTMAESRVRMPNWIGRLLCRLGFHDDRLIEVIVAFGASGQVRKVECRRCGYATTRSG